MERNMEKMIPGLRKLAEIEMMVRNQVRVSDIHVSQPARNPQPRIEEKRPSDKPYFVH